MNLRRLYWLEGEYTHEGIRYRIEMAVIGYNSNAAINRMWARFPNAKDTDITFVHVVESGTVTLDGPQRVGIVHEHTQVDTAG